MTDAPAIFKALPNENPPAQLMLLLTDEPSAGTESARATPLAARGRGEISIAISQQPVSS